MNIAELQAAVIEITNRPDLVAKTLAAVQAATLKAHHSDFYYKDIYEAEIDFTTATFEPDFEFRTFVPRWRAGKYFRKYDHDDAVPGDFFEEIVPENAMDSYAQARVDVWYSAGEIIHLKSSTEERYVLMGCYRHPDITTGTFDSWIALDHPYAIVYGAAQTIFRLIGKTDEARGMKEEVAEQYILLRNSNIIGSGY
jgi:hypothetical protein